jgi:hypothetical protein
VIRSLASALTMGLAGLTAAAGLAVPGGAMAATKTTAKTSASSKKAMDAAVSEAIVFVEKTRQVQFTSRPKIVVLSDKAFRAALKKEQEADPATARMEKELDATLLALRMIRRPATGQKLIGALTSSGVLGYYSPKTKTMTIRGTAVTPLVRTILVHELTHALDDQLHNLDRPEFDNVTDGTDEAFVFLVEGTARWVENKYRSSLSKSQRSRLSLEEAKLSFDPALAKVISDRNYSRAVLFLLPQLLNPYELGKFMVADLVEAEGTAGLEKALENFPTTTEQASSYKKLQKREPAVPVARPPFSGTKLSEGVLGIGGLNALLATPASLGGDLQLSTDAIGWGGDRYVVYRRKDERLCFRLDVAMDSPKDLSELKTALEDPAELSGGTVTLPKPDLIRFDSCDR